MQRFTDERTAETPDELWFTEHPPVYTLGLNASRDHLLSPGNIPVVQVDRGGQVTYHGPGQLMIYPLIDLKRAHLGVRDLVTALEASIVELAALHAIDAAARADAPGVYVEGRKIASVGLRIRRGASFHGMALNIDMDLGPFSLINPCGFSELEVTDLHSLGVSADRDAIQTSVQRILLRQLGYPDGAIVSGD
jgi:lipoyl(octanoyl) transferase